ncbi:MAG TPA: NADPH:quinone oxidoreductase family protein [Mycobacteriales bacterium]|nr:NADPH:quinone oxidoreductase family protein [Mycobacteriales bacterium]
MRAIQITEFGGPEVLRLTHLADPAATDPFDVVDVTGAGVNYADTHQVENTYLASSTLPLVPGSEVVGLTADGRRVASLVGVGGYAEKALVLPALTFEVPDDVTDGQALAVLVQGLSAWHLLRTSTHLAPGETVVVHAAAGGVGTIAIQLATAWGAGRVIAVASTADKRELALSLGADTAVDAGAEDLTAALRSANDGNPVDVVLEMVGGPTFDASLAALAPRGRLATYGMAGRVPPTPVDPLALMHGSRAVVGFWLVHFLTGPSMVAEPLNQMFAMIAAGTLSPVVGATYPLADARQAHEDLRARRSIGKLVLDPRS